MRTIEEIRKQILELIDKNPSITEKEIGKELSLSPRFMNALFDDMINKGELCQKS